jgi:hypothetical protein
MPRPNGGAGEGAGSERDSSRAGDYRRPPARRDGDEPHEGCLERACECVQADLAAAEKGRHYYSEQYAATGQQLQKAANRIAELERTVEHLTGELRRCADDGRTLYARGVAAGLSVGEQ